MVDVVGTGKYSFSRRYCYLLAPSLVVGFILTVLSNKQPPLLRTEVGFHSSCSFPLFEEIVDSLRIWNLSTVPILKKPAKEAPKLVKMRSMKINRCICVCVCG